MQEYFHSIIKPYILSEIAKNNLHVDQKSIILLDCWSVHKSREFRDFIRKYYPDIILVYIPPNCTGKLQVADVALNYSFKHGIKYRYEEWSCNEIFNQLESKSETLKFDTGMHIIKPLVLNWAVESWRSLENRPELIIQGWIKCMTRILDPYNEDVQDKATANILSGTLTAYGFVPDLNEPEPTARYCNEESDYSTSEDELDVMKRRIEGERKSSRRKIQSKPPFGNATIMTDQLEIDCSDDEIEEIDGFE